MSEVLPFPAAPAGDSLANIEGEAAFLGAVLIDNTILGQLSAPPKPEDFAEPVHARIYERVVQLLDRKAGAPIWRVFRAWGECQTGTSD